MTCIDEDGAGLLPEMIDRGTEFVAADINTRHIPEGMKLYKALGGGWQ